jgi:hypothetical protein
MAQNAASLPNRAGLGCRPQSEAPKPPPEPAPPVLTGDIRMVTRLVVKTMKPKKLRLFSQTRVRIRARRRCARLPQSGNYFPLFCLLAYFYNSRHMLPENGLSQCYHEMSANVHRSIGTFVQFVIGADVYNNESRVVLQVMIHARPSMKITICRKMKKGKYRQQYPLFDLHYVRTACRPKYHVLNTSDGNQDLILIITPSRN